LYLLITYRAVSVTEEISDNVVIIMMKKYTTFYKLEVKSLLRWHVQDIYILTESGICYLVENGLIKLKHIARKYVMLYSRI